MPGPTGPERSFIAIEGAQQAFSTRLPIVTFDRDLPGTVAAWDANVTRLALDNYESPERLGAIDVTTPVVLALGPERGWSAGERDMLRAAGFRFVHVGERVLRVETAAVAAVSLVRAKLGLM